jgi:hypothetical protein
MPFYVLNNIQWDIEKNGIQLPISIGITIDVDVKEKNVFDEINNEIKKRKGYKMKNAIITKLF